MTTPADLRPPRRPHWPIRPKGEGPCILDNGTCNMGTEITGSPRCLYNTQGPESIYDGYCGVDYKAGKCGLDGDSDPTYTTWSKEKFCWENSDCPSEPPSCFYMGAVNDDTSRKAALKCNVTTEDECLGTNRCWWSPGRSGKCFNWGPNSNPNNTCDDFFRYYWGGWPNKGATCDEGYTLAMEGGFPNPCRFVCNKSPPQSSAAPASHVHPAAGGHPAASAGHVHPAAPASHVPPAAPASHVPPAGSAYHHQSRAIYPPQSSASVSHSVTHHEFSTGAKIAVGVLSAVALVVLGVTLFWKGGKRYRRP